MKLTRRDIGRFEAFFWPGGPEECFIWLGYKDKNGYGEFKLNHTTQYAHRIAYWIEHGPFDYNLKVCHSCDNPTCVNPKHLFLGTDQDNVNDKMSKGREARGENNGRSVHTDERIDLILEMWKTGEYTKKLLADMAGVDSKCIRDYISGKHRNNSRRGVQ